MLIVLILDYIKEVEVIDLKGLCLCYLVVLLSEAIIHI